MGNITYDPADPENQLFYPDYEKHMGVLEDVDRRLASLFSQGLEECHNLEHFFKVSSHDINNLFIIIIYYDSHSFLIQELFNSVSCNRRNRTS